MRINFNFEPFTSDEIANPPIIQHEVIRYPIVPVPSSALPPRFTHPDYGPPVHTWAYIASGGHHVGYIALFSDSRGHKHSLPLTFCRTGEEERWHAHSLPRPYPLYNLPELESRHSDPVLIVRGEANVDASRMLFPGCVAVCCPYGDAAMHHADWSVLKGRDVIVLPHVDERMERFFNTIATLAYKAGAESVRRLDFTSVARVVWHDGIEIRRAVVPGEWDLAQAVAENWTAARVALQIGSLDNLPIEPKPLVYDDEGNAVFFVTATGLQGLVNTDRGPEKWVWVCDRLELVAQSRNVHGGSWGKRFRFWNDDGNAVLVDLSAKDLAADGAELWRLLLDLGFNMGHTREQRELLSKYVMSCKSPTRLLEVGTVGWHDGVFVTANGVIGKHPSGEEIRYAGGGGSLVGTTGGSASTWDDGIARMAVGNSRMVFALSAALSAPLLKYTGSEPGGFHFVGSSSIGKTTLLHVAGSVWGGGRINGYLDSWRATDNALEVVAAAHNDSLLCLDEIGQAQPKVVGALTYMLANGTGKSRMTKAIAFRDPFVWRTPFLSSGEVTLEAKIAEDYRSTVTAAGQAVRVVNIPADAGKGLGMFENIHGFSTAAEFAYALKSCALANFGHLALAFVQKLADDTSAIETKARSYMKLFVDELKLPPDADGQVKRVAAKFSVVAAAGEMATEWNLTPWQKGLAHKAVKIVFEAWLLERGDTAAHEELEAIAHIRHLLLAKRNTQFEKKPDSEDGREVRESLGFIDRSGPKEGETIYCFYAEAWKKDACKGMNHKLVASALLKRGYLDVSGSRLTAVKRFNGKTYRVYAVRESLLTEAEPVNRLDFGDSPSSP